MVAIRAPPAERLSDHLGVRLDESRLFWPETDGFAWIVVHLVSVIYGSVTAQGAHWAVFWGKEWEREFGVPDWLASWLAATSPQQDDPTAWSCWVDRHDVLTVRDTRRYGLPDTSIGAGARRWRSRSIMRETNSSCGVSAANPPVRRHVGNGGTHEHRRIRSPHFRFAG